MNVLELSEQEIIRRNSMNELRAMGIEPYPAAEYVTNAFSTDIKAEFNDDAEPRQVSVAGRIMSRRIMGKASFIELQDSKGRIQVYITRDDICPDEDKEMYNTVFKRLLDLGDFIGIEGFVFRTQMGEISIHAKKLTVLAKSIKPLPIVKYKDGVAYDSFEDPELRYRQRYVDLIVNDGVKEKFLKRATVIKTMRAVLDEAGYTEVETPILVGSTPEGARDFVVPSRMNPGQFYALPQSPQTLKQLLMVSGFDRYFQIAKCFRDEDLRADRQPEFTQIDCEMSFVEQDDVINLFEGMAKYLFKEIRGVEMNEPFMRMPWADAMKYYGSDKPDLRFGMKFVELMDIMKGHGFPVFDNAAYIGGICAEGAAHYTRKQLDALTEFVKRPQIGAKGMVYARVEADGNVKSSVDKFYAQEVLQEMKAAFNAKPGDLILILSGDDAMKTRKQLNELRLEMGNQLGLRDKNKFVCLWVVDFPMFEWSDEEGRLMAMHHPFTHPKDEDIPLLDTDPAAVRADAYDMVCNGIEVGGGSIRIHDAQLQAKMFEILGFTPEKAQEQFGFLMNAFKYGAPPHGGLAYGLDRWVSLFAGLDSIRDCIAFPKNNAGRDVMLDAPSAIDPAQLDELYLALKAPEAK